MNYLAHEFLFGGLPGPTHHFGGLSDGNIASKMHAEKVSHPKKAAMQVLNFLRFLTTLGIRVAILPPHERPHLPTLERVGFTGTNEAILDETLRRAPWILSRSSSAAAMFAANSATVSPSIDSINQHVNFTAANLAATFHRSIEHETTSVILRAIFPNSVLFEHHDAMPANPQLLDEGAANHIRFCRSFHTTGVNLFVYGMTTLDKSVISPHVFPARQTLEAAETVARLQELYPQRTVYAQQNFEAIDSGAFHNDLVSFGNQHVFVYHEKAFFQPDNMLEELKTKVQEVCGVTLLPIQINEDELSLDKAVESYFFNSLLLTLPDESMTLVCPRECQKDEDVERFVHDLIMSEDNPIADHHFVDLDEAMGNGGGPACLTLRVVLNENEVEEMNPKVILNDRLYTKLTGWIDTYYPETLQLKDLADHRFLERVYLALDELSGILQLGKIYPFQNKT